MKNKILVLAVAVTLVLIAACALAIYLLAPWSSTVGAASVTPTPGVVKTESRQVGNFSAVNFASVGELTITQGDAEALTIQAEERILNQIKTEVKDGVLTIRAVQDSPDSLNTSQGIYYTLTVKRLDSLTLAGAGNINARNIQTDQLAVTVNGAGKLDIAGAARQQQVLVSGAGTYSAGDLKTQTANITVTGVGSATVWVTAALDATIDSVGAINYYGSPQVKKQVKGLGSVTGLGNK